LITRGGYDPWIVEAALKNRQKHFVIDGEAVILGVDGVSSLISTRCIPASTMKRCSFARSMCWRLMAMTSAVFRSQCAVRPRWRGLPM